MKPLPLCRFIVISNSADLYHCSTPRRFLPAIRGAGIPLYAWLWNRTGTQSLPEDIPTTTLLSGGGWNNPWLLGWYICWMTRVFIRALLEPAGAIFVCHRFESAFPVAVASILRRSTYVFVNMDNVSMSYRWPRAIRAILVAAEGLVARRAILHVVPGRSRWPHRDSNLAIIPNYPSRVTIDAALELALRRGYKRESQLTIYVNGLLTQTRGLSTLVKAIRRCSPGTVHVLVAGEPLCHDAEELIDLAGVEYLGQLSKEEALAVYHRAHLVFTFYDPALEINRVAEPNKWGDCIATGTPFITNCEVQTAQSFIVEGQCLAVPYHDDIGLAQVITDLSRDRQGWLALKHSIEQVPMQTCDYAWSLAVARMRSSSSAQCV